MLDSNVISKPSGPTGSDHCITKHTADSELNDVVETISEGPEAVSELGAIGIPITEAGGIVGSKGEASEAVDAANFALAIADAKDAKTGA